MDRKAVKQQIQNSSVDDLKAWRQHAVKCLNYFTKYPNEFEQDECHFVINHIDQQLNTNNPSSNA